MDGWILRKLRYARLKQCTHSKSIVDFLNRLGVPTWNAWQTAFVFGALAVALRQPADKRRLILDKRRQGFVEPTVAVG
jgi:hypothetical protein